MSGFHNETVQAILLDHPEEVMLQYKKTGQVELRNQLVMHYLQYVNAAIYSMRSILLSSVPYEDFFNQGILALIDCIERYDPTMGVATFDTYSYTGIRGAILKYLRKQNWLPNRLWKMRKEISVARTQLEQELMREPTHRELAERLDLTQEKLSTYICEISVVDTVSFEAYLGDILGMGDEGLYDDSLLMEQGIMMEELQTALVKAIDKLPVKQRQILTLHYYENLKLKEIGQVLDLSQQRISQLRKKAIETLQEELSTYLH